jgi:hypothetical protein
MQSALLGMLNPQSMSNMMPNLVNTYMGTAKNIVSGFKDLFGLKKGGVVKRSVRIGNVIVVAKKAPVKRRAKRKGKK